MHLYLLVLVEQIVIIASNAPFPDTIALLSVGISTFDCYTKWTCCVCHPSTAEWRQCTPEGL